MLFRSKTSIFNASSAARRSRKYAQVSDNRARIIYIMQSFKYLPSGTRSFYKSSAFKVNYLLTIHNNFALAYIIRVMKLN